MIIFTNLGYCKSCPENNSLLCFNVKDQMCINKRTLLSHNCRQCLKKHTLLLCEVKSLS